MTKGKPSSTRADHCAIIESHNCGVPIDELCEKFSLKRSSINRIIKNYEQSGLSLVIKPRHYSNRAKLTKDQLAKVLCYYQSASKTYADVVKFIYCMFGVTVSRASVNHFLQRARRDHLTQSEQDSESIDSGQPNEDDEVHDLTLTESNESSEPTDNDGPSVTDFMESSMMLPDDTESEISYSFEF